MPPSWTTLHINIMPGESCAGQIKSSVIKDDKFYLSLNNSLSYHIAFADPHFHMSNINPAAIPYTMVRIEPKKNTWIYLKVCIPILDT